MAVDPNSVMVTREQVAKYLEGFEGSTREELVGHLKWSMGEDADLMVNTVDMAGRGGHTSILDMILDDLSSYGFDYAEK